MSYHNEVSQSIKIDLNYPFLLYIFTLILIPLSIGTTFVIFNECAH